MKSNPPSAREEDLFHRALALPDAERAALLDRECPGDPELRQAVAQLLEIHGSADSVLRSAAPELAATVALTPPRADEKPGDWIGRYKLLEKIGEGGFGTVYMAAQEEPVRRRVALKVIKLGMDTREVVARFEAERQALAMMDHPNIAKVLDGGATDTGRPYFVMDLVKGLPITTYCDQRQLSTRARLELFILVCQAVQHAHQKGVIHRDLKPSNILVTEQDDRPVPKVIDFGVARATQARLTEKTLFTHFNQAIGTPAYMSPEQTGLANLDIDTRSDVYALGVLLYELLTGRTPFDAKKLLEAGYEGIMRMIREVEPPKPSTRLSTLSVPELVELGGRRQEEPRRLGASVEGDLDWIVMKALEKDRTRRYETATNFAQDLQRHLDSEPVTARPPSAVYRLQKLARRHRGAFVAATVTFTALVFGLSLATYLFLRERAAHEVAAAATRKAEEANARTREALAAAQAAETEAMRQREAAMEENRRTRAAEARSAELTAEIDQRRRYASGIADAFGAENAALEKIFMPDDEKLTRALAAVAERERLSEDAYWAAINRFIAAVRDNPKADFRDRALADFAEKKAFAAVAAMIAARISPSGSLTVSGETLLLVGNRPIKPGTALTASYKGQSYEVELVSVDHTHFTLRYRGQEITRPIKPVK